MTHVTEHRWMPTMDLRYDDRGILQQRWTRRVVESSHYPGFWPRDYATRERWEDEWRDVPREGV